MPQSLAGQLQSIPMSPSLSQSFGRAQDFAREQSHRALTLEHLLLALTEDPDAAGVLRACNVDLDRLGTDISGYLGNLLEDMRAPPGTEPTPDPELLRVVEAARQAAQQSRRRAIDGAIVLAAIVGDAKSPAAGLLKAHGMTFEEAIRTLQKASAQARSRQYSASVRPAPERPTPERPAPERPAPEPAQPAPTPAPAAAPAQPAARAPASPSPTPDPPATGQTADEILAAARARIQQRRSATSTPSNPEPQPKPSPAPPAAEPETLPLMTLSSFTASPASNPVPDDLPPMLGRLPGQPEPKAGPTAAPPQAPAAPPRQPAPEPPPPTPSPSLSFGAAAEGPARPPPVPGSGAAAPRLPERLQRADLTDGPPTRRPPTMAPNGSLPGQRRPGLEPGPARPAARPAGSPRGGQRAAPGPLIEAIPRRMRVDVPTVAQVRISRDKVDALMQLLTGNRALPQPEAVVARVLSVRLRAPDGGFWIESDTPETQWIEAVPGQQQDEHITWQWDVTPYQRGRGRLQLMVSARTVGRDGVTAEAAPPDRIIEVAVRPRLLRRAARLIGMLALVGLGIGMGRLSQDRLAQDFVDIATALVGNIIGLLRTSGFL